MWRPVRGCGRTILWNCEIWDGHVWRNNTRPSRTVQKTRAIYSWCSSVRWWCCTQSMRQIDGSRDRPARKMICAIWWSKQLRKSDSKCSLPWKDCYFYYEGSQVWMMNVFYTCWSEYPGCKVFHLWEDTQIWRRWSEETKLWCKRCHCCGLSEQSRR